MEHLIKSLEVYDGIYKTKINTIKFDYVNPFNSKKYKHNTSLDFPFAFSTEIRKNGNTIYINPEFYRKNKKRVEKIIEETLRTTDKEYINLCDKELVKNQFLNAVLENKNIKKLEITSDVPISSNKIKELRNSGVKNLICSTNLINIKNFLNQYIDGVQINDFITFPGFMFYNFGGETVRLIILNHLTSKQINQLKKIFYKFPQNKVVIDLRKTTQRKQVIDVIKCKETIIKNDENYRKEDYKFFEDNFPNTCFEVATNLYVSSTRLREREEIFELIINEVKNKDLTTLEKYMYLYNIVKLFKEYKEVHSEMDLMLSRQSEFTLFNDYMVCVGYTTLLEELVTRLNDPNLRVAEYGCKLIDTNDTIEHHSRCLVKIKDEHYGINGTYISDPTWDSVKYYYSYTDENGDNIINENISLASIDYYNHFLMSYEEINDLGRKIVQGDVADVIFNKLKISNENFYDVMRVVKKFTTDNETTSRDIEREIHSTVQPKISPNIIVEAIKKVYSTVFESENDSIQTLVACTINHNNTYQKNNFNKTRNKFSKVLKKYLSS